MIDFSVGIRAWNAENRIPIILEKLRHQIEINSICWEIIIVDNNSIDKTAKIIKDYQVQWDRPFPIKYFCEPRQGALFARKRVIEEAQGALVGFLDDDNLPAPDWVAKSYAFGQAHPKAGAYSGLIHGIYEVEPPKNFKRIASCLAIIEWAETEPFCFHSQNKGGLLPPGAGIVIRKQAWVESVPENLELKGPMSGSLTAKGEDIEAFLYIRNAGWEIWFNPEMHIYHQIPKRRLEKDYLMRLLRGVGLSRHRTRMLGYKPWQRPLVIPFYMGNDLRKLINHRLKYGKELENDIVAASEMEMYLGSLESHLQGLGKFLRFEKPNNSN
ncbi:MULTISPECIES: hormogonium polysaccharide biosynthesis glycosyltransferase HpsE [unclassified Coleofasciculus]|uniref:hormogonium polysaccharide biosynthesis glycosyltransferase HpsE n=1 Tax=unclassified Coleofasciculus TaxID=2692782 RepID=UPI00187E279A|nr:MULTISPECIES: hormogonium polysaccharide biosynthesis glycosyltransferase HpsE [unclassified Coleofasciculus]MBE9126804.1 glycosyltransferase [Coleofasciculus sp. LEGE 07081]MBE9150175.1 glycosyltransferase [Coleofasciculus sp. LEGE 07092]